MASFQAADISTEKESHTFVAGQDVQEGTCIEKQKYDHKNADAALAIYDLDVSPADVAAVDLRKLIRKIDLRLMPIMFFATTLFTMDKATLSYSSIMGLRQDTHLTSDEYAWVGSVFSIGYLAANLPCAVIIQRLPLSKWIVVTMSIWGVILACTAAAKDYTQLVAIRVLLGIFEASITPVFVLMTGIWYTPSEQAIRLGLWYSGLGMATLIGSPIAYAISGQDKIGSLVSWQFLYIVFGAITVATAIVFLFVVPDSQLSARFLTPAERVAAVERIRVNQQGIGNRHFKWYQAREVLLDPRTYLYFAVQFVYNIGFGAVSTFSSLLLVSLGFDKRQALIYTMPHGGTTIVAMLIFCGLAARMNDRTLWAGLSCLGGAVAGLCLYGLNDSKYAALAAFYFQHICTPAYILSFSLVSVNTAGHTKKVLTNAVLLLGSTSGTLTGPQVTKNDPSYTKVKLVMWLCPLISLVLFAAIRVLNVWENRRRDRQSAVNGQEHLVDREFLDQTDQENPEFRYLL